MTFLNPFFLYFLPLATIPVILHILNKSRFKKVEFSSLQFLLELQNDVIKKLKLKQLLLLILRTLIIILFIMAFARPVIKTERSSLHVKQGQTLYLVVDNSFSMGKTSKGQTLMEQQIARIIPLLENSSFPANVRLIKTTSPGQFDYAELTRSAETVVEELTEVEVSSMNGDLIKTLNTIHKDIQKSKLVSPLIWVLSDFQKPDGDYTAELEAKISDLSEYQMLFFQAQFSEENYSIVEAIFPNQLLEINSPVSISTQTQNEGQSGQIPLGLFLEGERAGRSLLDFSDKNTQFSEFQFIPTSSGVLNGKLSLSDDNFLADNEHYFSVHIPEKIKLLLTVGEEEANYLQKAIQVNKSGLSLETVNRQEFAARDLYNFDVIILSQIEGINLDLITSYLEQGGGLLIIPGQDEDRQYYNQFARKNQLPIWTQTRSFSGDNYLKLGTIDEQHPIFQNIWKGQRKFNARFYRIPEFKSNNHQVIATYEQGQPFLMIPKNNSQIVIMATNPSRSWSDIQFTGLFAPLVHRILTYLGGQKDFNYSYTIGDTISIGDFNIEDTQDLTITTPSAAEYIPGGEENKIFDKTQDPGIYKIYTRNQPVSAFAVNISKHEKKCEYLSNQDFEKLGSIYGSNLIFNKDKTQKQTTAGELSPWIFFLTLGLIFAETWLSQSE
ncbi:MAG TPA: BatA domain-containing protein [bacterium]|nr:BatA domain-containing protein [bacterium]